MHGDFQIFDPCNSLGSKGGNAFRNLDESFVVFVAFLSILAIAVAAMIVWLLVIAFQNTTGSAGSRVNTKPERLQVLQSFDAAGAAIKSTNGENP